MRNKIKLLFLAITWLIIPKSSAQSTIKTHSGLEKFQYGFSTRIVYDIDFSGRKYSNIRIGFGSGIGLKTYSSNFSSLNFEYSLLCGGLGTYDNNWSQYFVFSLHFCQAVDLSKQPTDNDGILKSNQPLYYFSDLVTPSLQNPFKRSISIGANFIHFINKKMTHKWQRVAHLGFKFNEAQLVYNNDGGAILEKWGDREDRYFTGSGFLKIRLDDHLGINDFGISFYKFTGYFPMSFEIGDEMLYSSVDYKDTDQHLFNRGFWSFQVGNSNYGDVFVRYNNSRNTKEVQNFIHYVMGFGYHQNPTDSYYSYGGSLTNYQINIPKL